MTEFELGWAVGLFEGEGSVLSRRSAWIRRDGSRAFVRPQIYVNQVDRSVLDRLQILFGGRINGPYQPRGLGKQPFYQWWLTTPQRVTEFVRSVGPYLSARRQEQIVDAYWNYEWNRVIR